MSAEQLDALRTAPLATLPNKVRLARTLLGLKQVQLARAAGLEVPNLSDIERGEYKDVPLETARKLAEALSVAIEDLFPSREESPRPPQMPLPLRVERSVAAR